MKQRIIIDIWDNEISDEYALMHVLKVVRYGKESERRGKPCYCFLTQFNDTKIRVQSDLLKSGTHKFTVSKVKKQNQ